MQDSRPLRQKVAVITGASRGIGRAIAEHFAAAGCDLALCARNAKFLPAESIADPHGVRVLVSECDVRSETSVGEFFAAIKLRFGNIDILVNNAGVAGPMATVEKVQLDDWRDAVDTSLTGTFLCTRAALPLMRRGGVIVNNLSVAARSVFCGESPYVSAKHGAKGFTDTLRVEVRDRGIRVIGLYPGPTDTDIWNQFWPAAPRDRMMSPDTVAQAVLHAVILPENATVEELVLMPTRGSL
jgi:NAD(P)-dependent dehydrogenase (short-subunit alcohol dehydrogenase family)